MRIAILPLLVAACTSTSTLTESATVSGDWVKFKPQLWQPDGDTYFNATEHSALIETTSGTMLTALYPIVISSQGTLTVAPRISADGAHRECRIYVAHNGNPTSGLRVDVSPGDRVNLIFECDAEPPDDDGLYGKFWAVLDGRYRMELL